MLSSELSGPVDVAPSRALIFIFMNKEKCTLKQMRLMQHLGLSFTSETLKFEAMNKISAWFAFATAKEIQLKFSTCYFDYESEYYDSDIQGDFLSYDFGDFDP